MKTHECFFRGSPRQSESRADIASAPLKIPPLKIHWRLCQGGRDYNRSRARTEIDIASALPDLEQQLEFACTAERMGVDSLLVDYGYNKPDSIVLSTAIGLMTRKIRLIIACRSGVMSPTAFVQQLNTLAALIQGRLSLNVVAGHSPEEQKYYGDFLPHDQRFSRTEEYLMICREFWRKSGENDRGGVDFSGKYYRIENARLKTPYTGAAITSVATPVSRHPELFIAGSSAQARALTMKVGDTWVSVAEAPEAMRHKVQQMCNCGKEVAIRLSIICRPTKEEAVAAAGRLLAKDDGGDKEKGDGGDAEKRFVSQSDSVGIKRAYNLAVNTDSHWLTDYLWNGAVKTHGAPAIALVGNPAEIAAAIMEYKRLGVSQLILSGWPQYEEMCLFGKYVMPLIRECEKNVGSSGKS